jgi:putative flippase GtrA
VYATLIHVGLHYLLAATCSFLVAVTSNHTWNRLWTFRDRRRCRRAGHAVLRRCARVTRSEPPRLHLLITIGAGKLVGQAIAIIVVTPLNFIGNRLWSFKHPRKPR